MLFSRSAVISLVLLGAFVAPSVASEEVSAPAVSTPSTAFLAAVDAAQRERVALDALDAARVGADAARSRVFALRALTGDMTVAQMRAEEQVADTVRAAYMMGEPPTTSELIIQSNGDDVADVVSGVALADHATRAQAVDASRALGEVEAWRGQLAEAERSLVGAQQILDGAVSEAEVLRQEREFLFADVVLGTSEAVRPGRGEFACPVLEGPNSVSVEFCEQVLAGVGDEVTRSALLYGFWHVGVPYACDGVGRDTTHFDCSSLVARAFMAVGGQPQPEGAYTATTATMMSDPRYVSVEPGQIAPGDLVVWDTCPPESADADAEGGPCSTRHVAWYLGVVDGVEWMLHTNVCGGGVHVEEFWGVAGEVYPLLGVKRLATA